MTIIRKFEAIADRVISRESGWLEFKESFNWNSKDKYAKTMAAFANNKGGYIIFGVKDKPRDLVGLQSNNFDSVDEAKIAAYLNSMFAPEIQFEKFVITVHSKNIGFLYTYQAKTMPTMCLKNDGELKESDIYYRYNARTERIKYSELKAILDIAREEERKSWMEHLEKISRLGSTNIAIMNILSGEITGKSGTLIIDKKLLPKLKFINQGHFQEKGKPVLRLIGDVKPVIIFKATNYDEINIKVTGDHNAPTIRLEEKSIREQYPLDYSELCRILADRYLDFKTNSKFHQLRKELMKDPNMSRARYLDPNKTKSIKKDFYSRNIIEKFDDYYKKK